MSILEVNNIRKSFGDNEVLKDISFNLDTGKVLSKKIKKRKYYPNAKRR